MEMHTWRLSNLDDPFSNRHVCTQTGPTPECLSFPPFSCETRAWISSKGWQTAPVQRAQHHIFTYITRRTWQWAGPKGQPPEGHCGTPVPMGEPGRPVCLPQVLYKRESSCWAMALGAPTLWQFSRAPSEPCKRQTDCLLLTLWLGNDKTGLLQKLCRTSYVH